MMEGGITEANDEHILANFLLRFFVEYQHTKVKGNGKSGRTLCPSFAMLYLLENMGCFTINKLCNEVGGLFKIRYLHIH